MSSIVMQGSIYTTITGAALAWAGGGAPRPDRHRGPPRNRRGPPRSSCATGRAEAERIGEDITPEEVSTRAEWKTAIIAALVSRIVRGREGATADDPDARRYRVTFDRPRGAGLASTLVLLEREPMTADAVRVVAAQHHVHARLRHVETGEDVESARTVRSSAGRPCWPSTLRRPSCPP